jgi:hypothetical protein
MPDIRYFKYYAILSWALSLYFFETNKNHLLSENTINSFKFVFKDSDYTN